MRDPVAVVERGHRECGEVFAMRLAARNAVVLLGPESSRFFSTPILTHMLSLSSSAAIWLSR